MQRPDHDANDDGDDQDSCDDADNEPSLLLFRRSTVGSSRELALRVVALLGLLTVALRLTVAAAKLLPDRVLTVARHRLLVGGEGVGHGDSFGLSEPVSACQRQGAAVGRDEELVLRVSNFQG